MKFDIKDLPYSQFEQLGMSKKDVLNMKPQDLANMLEGKRTGLLSLRISMGVGMKPLTPDAKLSLSRNPDNTLSLGVHPILATPTNTIGATPEQWDKMLKGEPIVKDSKSYNGVMEPHIHQLDKQTNEILSTRLASIQLPNAIKDIVLTPGQKEQLKKGLPVELENKTTKEVVLVRIDLNEPKGFKLSSEQQANSLKQESSSNQQKAMVEAPNLSAGQKLDNKENTAFIIHSNPKNEPMKTDRYVVTSNDEVYARVSALAKDNNLKVEKIDGLKESDIKTMQQGSTADYVGKGKIVLTCSEGGQGINIKDSALKGVFERQDALKGGVGMDGPKDNESVSIGRKR